MPIDDRLLIEAMQEDDRRSQEIAQLKRDGNIAAALEKAKELFHHLHDLQEALPYVLHAANNLAALYGVNGDWATAERIFETSLTARTNVLGDKHFMTSTALMMLGVAKMSLNKFQEAQPLLERCVAIREEICELDDIAVSIAIGNLAALCDKIGRSTEADSAVGWNEHLNRPGNCGCWLI